MSYSTSKFKPFTLKLMNSATLTGISFTPTPNGPKSSKRPLMVLIHGGGCHSGYFDVSNDHTASHIANALSLPVIAINRPCYEGTSTLFPLPDGSSFHKETGRWEHEFIFPAIWRAFGEPNGCSAIVAMAHSMGTPGLLVAASMYAQAGSTLYPLAGLVVSGWGCRPNSSSQDDYQSMTKKERFQARYDVMLSNPRQRAADEEMRKFLSVQTVDAPPEEAKECVSGPWKDYFPEYAARIDVPIMFGVGEYDYLWQGTQDHVTEFAKFFTSCPRFDGSVVRGAPHAID